MNSELGRNSYIWKKNTIWDNNNDVILTDNFNNNHNENSRINKLKIIFCGCKRKRKLPEIKPINFDFADIHSVKSTEKYYPNISNNYVLL